MRFVQICKKASLQWRLIHHHRHLLVMFRLVLEFQRVAPELSVTGLERFVREFYEQIGPTTILGISLFENGYCGLLTSLLPDGPPSTVAWLIISRLSSTCKPAVLLQPIHSIAGPSVDTSLCPPCERENTIVDKVAQVIRWLARPLKDVPLKDWVNLSEQYVEELLKDMEQKWFGKWKFLLLGQSIGVSGCYIGWKDPIPSHTTTSTDISFYRRMTTGNKSSPLILVLDMDMQMLPWESMEIVKCEDMYHMPSVSSILYTYVKCTTMPIIDPFDAYYRMGPPESCHSNNLETLLKSYHLEGKKSKDPNNIDELFKVLLSRDLFFYIGHRDGSNCIFGDHLKNLPKCSAAILMACNSGVLDSSGSYMARGHALNYILAGSLFVIATLWTITDNVTCNYCRYLFDLLVGSRKCIICHSTSGCEHTPNIGSFIGEARKRCMSKKFMGPFEFNIVKITYILYLVAIF